MTHEIRENRYGTLYTIAHHALYDGSWLAHHQTCSIEVELKKLGYILVCKRVRAHGCPEITCTRRSIRASGQKYPTRSHKND